MKMRDIWCTAFVFESRIYVRADTFLTNLKEDAIVCSQIGEKNGDKLIFYERPKTTAYIGKNEEVELVSEVY